jgi:bifunctional non-homologous end joining protein LigD
MALEEYRAKRDFRKTPEPGPRGGKGHGKPIFVVQEHHASRLHYDFRLEAGGVLKSWAIPKGPSMDPAEKRLAVRVEDHPLEYAGFAGTIPEGQYGAGEVEIWDRGTYDNLLAERPQPQTVSQGIEAGRLEFTLHGKRLQGDFALIRMRDKKGGKENWLLIKKKDAFARPEEADGGHAAPKAKSVKPARASRPAARRKRSSAEASAEPEVTHPDKLYYPDAGITKADVIDFYRRIAPRLLPHLRDRPATLERLPEGVGEGAPHFWQKNAPAYYPDWIPIAELPTERGKSVRYVLVNDRDTLLYLVNQGSLTFHPWFSRVQDLDRPDFVLFDLDPGAASFADAVAVARELHGILQGEDVEAFVKTSGKTGLHVLTSWEQDGGYDAARAWALGIAERVVAALPERATVERGKAKRQGRVYVDVMQNAKGHHAVPPYVLRAVPGAPVSTPLDWRELTPDLDPKAFNLKTIFRRLARKKHDPMAGLTRAPASARG